MWFSADAVMYLFSLLVLVFSLLLYLTIGGAAQRYFRSYLRRDFIEDSEAGDLLNPAQYVEPFVLVIFIFFGILVSLKKQPISEEYTQEGVRGFFEKFLMLFMGGILHLFIASFFLFLGVFIWKIPFFVCAVKTSLRANSHFILNVSNLFSANGPTLLAIVFSLVSVVLNLHIAVLDFIFSLLDIFLKKYLAPYLLDFKFLLFIYLLFLLFFMFFGNMIMCFFWKLISLPLYFLF